MTRLRILLAAALVIGLGLGVGLAMWVSDARAPIGEEGLRP